MTNIIQCLIWDLSANFESSAGGNEGIKNSWLGRAPGIPTSLGISSCGSVFHPEAGNRKSTVMKYRRRDATRKLWEIFAWWPVSQIRLAQK
jgi:hypothetical protein